MERSAIESGALPAAIVDHVAREATRMKPALTVEQSRKVGQVILDWSYPGLVDTFGLSSPVVR